MATLDITGAWPCVGGTATGETETEALALALPPLPEHEREYVELAVGETT
jgi:hypothetical protein